MSVVSFDENLFCSNTFSCSLYEHSYAYDTFRFKCIRCTACRQFPNRQQTTWLVWCQVWRIPGNVRGGKGRRAAGPFWLVSVRFSSSLFPPCPRKITARECTTVGLSNALPGLRDSLVGEERFTHRSPTGYWQQYHMFPPAEMTWRISYVCPYTDCDDDCEEERKRRRGRRRSQYERRQYDNKMLNTKITTIYLLTLNVIGIFIRWISMIEVKMEFC